LLQNANGNTNGYGYLRLFSITGAIGSETLNNVTNPVYIRTSETWSDGITNWADFAPQTNSTDVIGTAPDSKLQDVVYRNGSLWCAHTIFLPATNVTRSAVQWWQIQPGSGSILQRGRIDDSLGDNFYAFPSIAVNKFNDVLIGYSSFSPTQYATASYSFRAFYDQENKVRAPYHYRLGEAHFEGRFGDYSGSTIDPLNDTDLWTIQEYATTNSVGEDQHWGTRWAHVALPVPTNDAFAASFSVSGAQGSTNGTTIRATREASEPNHAGSASTPSVWYTWVAPANGNVALELTNTFLVGFEAAISVYTGSAVGSLTPVTSKQAAAPKVTFNAANGTTYRIAVSGYNNSAGDFALIWKQPTAPYFVQHPQTTNAVVGENVMLTSVAIGTPDPTYQWRQEGTNLVAATNANLTLTNIQLWHGTNYTVVASNSSGMSTSLTAGLIVHSEYAARLSNLTVETNAFRVHISGVTNRPYVVQTTTNLNTTNWYPIHTNTVSFWYTNFPITSDWRRFYRVITN